MRVTTGNDDWLARRTCAGGAPPRKPVPLSEMDLLRGLFKHGAAIKTSGLLASSTSTDQKLDPLRHRHRLGHRRKNTPGSFQSDGEICSSHKKAEDQLLLQVETTRMQPQIYNPFEMYQQCPGGGGAGQQKWTALVT